MYHVDLCQVDLLVVDVLGFVGTVLVHVAGDGCLQEVLGVRVLYGVDVDVGGVESFVLVAFSITFRAITLYLCLHYTANCDDISRYARVYKIIFYLTLNGLRHFASVDIINVIFDLLNLESLIERRPGSMLFRIEQPAPAINVDASVWCFPFAINETYNNL